MRTFRHIAFAVIAMSLAVWVSPQAHAEKQAGAQ